jgi:hypothetical protein
MKRERRSRAPISNLSDPAVCAVLIALGARVSTSSSTQESRPTIAPDACITTSSQKENLREEKLQEGELQIPYFFA